MTIKPVEGMSQALVKSFYNISDDETRRNEIYVLLNKWSETSVFAQTELVAFLKQEMQKDLNWHYNQKAGTLDIRVRKNAYAGKTPPTAEFDDKTMVEVDGVNRYKATCKEIVKFVADEQEKELQVHAFTGYKLVCIKCYEDCSEHFKTPAFYGSCRPVLSDGCSFVKEEL
jgi:predicted restriction endonuclease